jgi:dihydroorotase
MILLKNATILDQQSAYHLQQKDVLIDKGIIDRIEDEIAVNDGTKVIDVVGLHLSIGWFDSSVSFGEPGFEEKQTLENGLNAAASGGFTTVMLNPNNKPNPQDESGIHYLKNKTAHHLVDLIPVGNLTLDQGGEHLAELYDMHQAGAISFYDFKKAIENPNLMKVALQYVKSFNGVIQSYPQDNKVAGKGMVNEDVTNTHLGLKAMPPLAEHLQIARDVQIALYTDSRLHIPTVSTIEGLKVIKEAKKKTNKITCSVSVNHLLLDSTRLNDFNTVFKVQPPLRDEKTVKALLKAVKNAHVDMITSDHIPLTVESKAVEFDQADYGSIGLESAYKCLVPALGAQTTVQMLTAGYEAFGLERPEITVGATANLTLFTTEGNDYLSSEDILSTSKNAALLGEKTQGAVIGVINGVNSIIHE